MKKKLKKGLSIFFISILLIFSTYLLLNYLYPLEINIDYSKIIFAKDSTVIYSFLSTDDKWRMYTEIDEISPDLKKAILYKEDKYFYNHFGINPLAILRALKNNIVKQKRTSGASTITMQVARLLEPKKRTYFNKFIEMFRAVQLETKYTKEEILQLYLNLVPYGGNIEGVKAASLLYFDKMPNKLSLAEITTLSIIPNRPSSLILGKNNDIIAKERNRWLEEFRKENLFSNETIEDAVNEPLDAYRQEIPRFAPHFSLRIDKMISSKTLIYTTIDINYQTKIENLVKDYIKRLYFKNIKNATVLVVDNETHEIISYVGSSDFYNEEDGGQVDGIQAIRSPGSTLKPFLYSIAFDEGLITPKYIIGDVPINYSGYRPENYDEKYQGNVTIEFALSQSLNVPAVKILEHITTEVFIKKLIDAKFLNIEKNKSNLGLSVILGGCGVSLEQLVRLYSSFANEGKFKELCFTQNDSSSYYKQLISEESAFMITEILTQVTRPDLPMDWENSTNLPRIAWKTGTSYGRKDAWSIGYNKKYTVGVWIGNFASESIPELNGSQYAAPLLFDIFNLLEYNSQDEWFSMPEKLDFRTVCSESGLIPSENCENLIIDYYIPGISSTKVCEHIKEVYISPDSTISYCTNCLPSSGYIKALYKNYTPDLINFYELYNISYQKIPTHNPKCERVFNDNYPQITSPVANIEYLVDKQDSTQIMLSCNVSNDVENVFWYVNDKFFKSVAPVEKVFFTPPNGSVKISCSDDKARNTDIWIDVKYISF